jgi:hypothetical protein
LLLFPGIFAAHCAILPGFYSFKTLVSTTPAGEVGQSFELHDAVLAKVQLLPFPHDPDGLGGPRDVVFDTYKRAEGVPFVFVSPRRFVHHAVIVRRFQGSGLELAEMGYFYETRK